LPPAYSVDGVIRSTAKIPTDVSEISVETQLCRLGLKLNPFGDSCLLAAFGILALHLRQVQSPGDGKTCIPRAHRQTHRRLAVIVFADFRDRPLRVVRSLGRISPSDRLLKGLPLPPGLRRGRRPQSQGFMRGYSGTASQIPATVRVEALSGRFRRTSSQPC
jgi:hypothetical protein